MGNLILEAQQIGPRHVVVIAPHRRPVTSAYELNADPKSVASLLKDPRDKVIAGQNPTRLQGLDQLVFVAQDGTRRTRRELLHDRQSRDDRVGNADT